MSAPGYHPPPPQPANPWGPFTAGDLLRRTFQLYREHFALFLGISALGAVLTLVVQLPFQLLPFLMRGHTAIAPTQAIAQFLIVVPFGILSAVLALYIYSLIYGTMFTAVSHLRQGKPASITAALEETAPRSLRLLGAYLLVTLRVFGWLLLFVFAVMLICVLLALVFHAAGVTLPMPHGMSGGPAASHGNFAALGFAFLGIGLVLFVGVVAYLFFILWLYSRYLLFVPAILAENAGANAAVHRSVELSKGSRGRIYALLIFCFFLQIVAVVSAAPFFYLAIHTGRIGPTASPVIVLAEFVVITFVQMLLMHPILGIGTALCYFDLRARKDAAPIAPPPLPSPTTPSWEPPTAVVQPPSIEHPVIERPVLEPPSTPFQPEPFNPPPHDPEPDPEPRN